MAAARLTAGITAAVSLSIWLPVAVLSVNPTVKRFVFRRPLLFKMYLTLSFWPYAWLRRWYFRIVKEACRSALYVDCSKGFGDRQAKVERSHLPQKAGDNVVRCVCISDTHNLHEHLGRLPDADVLIHCGDFLWESTAIDEKSLAQLRAFDAWLSKQTQFAERVVIGGNHDGACMQLGRERTQELLSNATYLLEESRTLKCGLRVFGSPLSRRESSRSTNRAFQPPVGDDISESKAASIPADIDVLVTHGGPKDILDGNFGSNRLADRVAKIHPTAHVFGHVHSGHGVVIRNGTVFANCANVDSMYAVSNPPVVLDILVPRRPQLSQTQERSSQISDLQQRPPMSHSDTTRSDPYSRF